MKKYLIVGASGFVGSNIFKILPSKIDLTIITSKKNKILKLLEKKKFSNILIKNYYYISKKNKKILENYDIIINSTGAYPKNKNNKKLIFLNYKLPKLLYDLSSGNTYKKFININTMLRNRKKTYVKFKHKLSDYLKKKNKGSTHVIDLHISHLYGDPNHDKEFISDVINKIVKKKKILKVTKGLQKRDFLHILDFQNFFIKVLKFRPKKKYTRFEIGNYESHSIKSIILFLKKITFSDIDIKFGEIKYKKNEEFLMKCNIKTLTNTIKWKPKIDIFTGIKTLLKNINDKNY